MIREVFHRYRCVVEYFAPATAKPSSVDLFRRSPKHHGMRFTLIMPVLVGLAACGNGQSGAGPEPDNLCLGNSRCVSAPARDVLAVDGDTFELQRLTDRGVQRIRLRLIGWDSPESGDAAQCLGENDLGVAVERRAQAMLADGSTVTFLPEGTDQYGRTRAHVWLDGTHIGWRLAGEGLSERYAEDGMRPDWCS